MKTHASPKRRMDRPKGRGTRVLIGLLAAAALVTLAGYGYQEITTRADFRHNPAPGRLIDVGGRQAHIYCQGTGSPTVVVEAGAGDFSLGWGLVQPAAADFTRICVSDRPGYGWSEPAPGPRTARLSAEELHTLLAAAGEEPPYILVGHSLGGYIVRAYAGLYPDEIAGMVLVDAGHEEQLERLPAEYLQINRQQVQYFGVLELLARFGILRLMGPSAGEAALPAYIKHLPGPVQEIYISMLSHPSYFNAYRRELLGLEESCQQVAALDSLDDLPLIVLTAGKGLTAESLQAIGLPAEYPVDQIQDVWLTLQEELAGLSSAGTQLIAEDSGHAVHLEQPELVIEAIRDLVSRTRPQSP